MDEAKLISVAEALAGVLARARPLETENVPLAQAWGRTLALDLASTRTQPPEPVSAMDGYALDARDGTDPSQRLKVVGTSSAGHRFHGTLQRGEAVRIFTGAIVPPGADAVQMQELVTRDGDAICLQQPVTSGRSVRAAGLDFSTGEILLRAGRRLGAAELALAAAMNHGHVPLVRRPRVAILATGDELVRPGTPPGPDQIVASNSFAIAAHVLAAGGEPIDLGIAADSFAALEAGILAARAASADVLVTLGGASVGDHDLVKSALTREGMDLHFWRIAMRPGKPLIHGSLGAMHILGLPGNPVSSIVCGHLFLQPLVRALSGDTDAGRDITVAGVLGADMPANDGREDYVRATSRLNGENLPVVTAFGVQDSSMLRVLAEAECLLVRAPHAPAGKKGDACRIIRLEAGR
ncbi:MAG: molybdopterin molybdotransferase MoeA [Hyphomicrobiales bacterium]|nr:molybdopterin molybdotransferase MoeA [Hyphomicrobiales bacterium]